MRSPGNAKLKQFLALCYLLGLGGLALAGPYGVLSWGENLSLLDKREAQIAQLTAQSGAPTAEEEQTATTLLSDILSTYAYRNLDMAGELIRSDLNVVHPDEYIYQLHDR